MSADIAMARVRKVHVDSQISRGTRTIIPAAEISADVLKDFHKLLFAGDRGETKLRLVKPASWAAAAAADAQRSYSRGPARLLPYAKFNHHAPLSTKCRYKVYT